MADEGTTARQAPTDDESGLHRLRDIVVEEVSLVDRAANKRRFLLVKRSSQMANDGRSKGATSEDGEAGATSGAGARGRKPRSKPDHDTSKARARTMRAVDDDEENEEETEKAGSPTESEDKDNADDEDDQTEKARRSDADEEGDDEEELDDDDQVKAADQAGENGEAKPTRGRRGSSGKPARGANSASDDKRSGGAGKRARKAEDDALVLPTAAKNSVLRALAQALERLMAVANQVKEADEPDDETQISIPDGLTEELEDVGELIEDIGEQLDEPAEKSCRNKSDDTKARASKAGVTKAGRRMAKDRLERFQKALELLAAVLKELTAETPGAAAAGAAEKPLDKRVSPDVGALVTNVQELTRAVKQQGEQLGRLQKMRATSNAIPVEGGARRRDVQDVSWPLDMNRPITRDRVDKASSFYDEE
jgi:hypothetical protein